MGGLAVASLARASRHCYHYYYFRYYYYYYYHYLYHYYYYPRPAALTPEESNCVLCFPQ